MDPIDAGTERGLEIERDPEIWRRCGRPRPSKRGTGYAQDDERGTPNGEGASNHVRRALEPLSPRLVAQHHTLRVARAEGPAQRRRHAKRGEELGGHEAGSQDLRSGGAGTRSLKWLRAGRGDDGREGARPCANLRDIGVRQSHAGGVPGRDNP